MDKPFTENLGTFIDPLTDVGFKILFGRESSKDILIGFLNVLLDTDGADPITDISYLDKEKVKERPEERSVIYDLHCETKCGKRFILEMQAQPQLNFIDRTIFYTARAITEQGRPGTWRYDYKRVIGIFFSNFPLSVTNPKLRTDVVLSDTESHEKFSDKILLIYLQLSEFKITNPEDCKNDFERWIYIIKNMGTMNTMPFASINKIYKRIEEVGRISNLSPEQKRQYERDLKAYRDFNNIYLTAQEKGMAEGMEKGMQQGLQQGLQQGMQQGLQQGMQSQRDLMIRQLANSGMSAAQMAKTFNLSEEVILSILK